MYPHNLIYGNETESVLYNNQITRFLISFASDFENSSFAFSLFLRATAVGT